MWNIKHTIGAMVVAAGCGSLTTAQGPVVAPINNWSYLNHASTPAEGFLRGNASVIQSAGEASYLNSLAAVNYEEARRRWIENSNLYVKTYFDNKETGRSFREKYSAKPPSKERWSRVIEMSLPDRLTDKDFDASTGRLIWPHVLRGEEYKVFRDGIDRRFASRTPENSGDGSPFQREIKALADGMLAVLKSNIDNVSASQYGAAKWFIFSIQYEAELPLEGSLAAVPDAAPNNTVQNVTAETSERPTAVASEPIPETK